MGSTDDVAADLTSMQGVYRENLASKAHWRSEGSWNLDSPYTANPSLYHGDALRPAGLSPAVHYHMAREHTKAHLVFNFSHVTVMTVGNACDGDTLPAQVTLDEAAATRGAKMLFQGGADLQELLFESGILYLSSTGDTGVSMTSFRKTFVEIAYVIVGYSFPLWKTLQNPLCTCRVHGVQQQCQHTLFAEMMGISGTKARDCGDAPQQLRSDRPKGRGKAKP